MNIFLNNKRFTRTLNFSKRRSLVCGFTLVELMVAISIFMMVMLMAMGSLVVAFDTSKKADGLRNAMDSVNFAMESMTRSIRMGTAYSLGSRGENSFSFKDSEGSPTEYYKINSTLMRKRSGSPVPIISSEVKVDTLQFFVGDATKQPSVYIIMKGVVTIKGQDYSFALQTLASQRNPK